MTTIEIVQSKSKSLTKKSLNKVKTVKDTEPIKQLLPTFLCEEAPLFVIQKQKYEGFLAENTELIRNDLPKFEELLTNYIQGEKQTAIKVGELKDFSCEEGRSFESGLKFYSCKNIIFNEYLVCLKMYELFRLNAIDFTTGAGLKLYQRLVYLKTLILKLAPIEKKLEYQKNKLLKQGEKIKIKDFNKRAESNNQNNNEYSEEDKHDEQQEEPNMEEQAEVQSGQQQDKLAYKPQLTNLIKNKEANKSQKQKQGKYVAPRQSAVLPAEQKVKRRQERQKQRRKAHLLQKFRGDIQSGDEAEEKNMLEGIDPRFKQKYQQKMRYEEENFTRINETKKEKYFKKQMMKNIYNNTLNNQLKEIELVRELVADDTREAKRPRPISLTKKSQSRPTLEQKGHKRRKQQ